MNTSYILLIIVITILLILVILPFINLLITDNFTNGSGYGFNVDNHRKLTTITGLSPIAKASDFKLLSLMSKIKYSFTKPVSAYIIDKNDIDPVPKNNNVNKNIILFPGNTDYVLKQNDLEVWPRNAQNIDNKKNADVHNNNGGHFSVIRTLLKNVGYTENENVNSILYDFREFDIEQILMKFKNYLKNDTVIIAYDFGAVIANICINRLSDDEKNKIEKFLLICPTIGGVPMTLRDYFTNSIITPQIIENYHSILMSMPVESMYKNPVAIYNNLSYKATTTSLSKLLEYENKPSELFKELRRLQEESLNNPGVNCIIIGNNDFSTPISYDFSDDLKKLPVRYCSNINNIQDNEMFEGIQGVGDKIVPYNSISQLHNMWNDNSKLEIIKDKDHFTILKSYELALIIMANI